MHKQLDLTKLGGVYAYQDTLKYMQEGYGGALDALAAGAGNKFVLTGCVDSGAAVGNGWVIIDGEIMPFVGAAMPGTPMVKVTETITKELYDDGVQKDFYYTKVASLVSVGDFDYSDLQRLPGAKGIMQSLLDVQQIVKAMAIENAVILEGCAVSDINTGTSTCDIAAGKVMLGGVLFETTAQVGATYPIYITSDGTFNNALPAAPYIKFDPHTSQRYADVVKRNTTPVGEIKMFKTLSDRFDTGTGLGKWEMLGFKLEYTMQSRVPVGLRFDGVAEANVSDANYDVAGNQGGEKGVTLDEAGIPAHRLKTFVDQDLTFADFPEDNDAELTADRSPVKKYFKTGAGAESYIMAADEAEPTIGRTSEYGGGEAHNNVQPYTVVVYAERI